MESIPALVPPLPTPNRWHRPLTLNDPRSRLAKSWSDFAAEPASSIGYGLLIFVASAVIVTGLFRFGLDYILFPAFAGFMIVGPILAIGLYEKSRRIEAGLPPSFLRMILVKPASGGQMLFAGVLLCLLMIAWMRAAVIIYALFFGLTPFPGLDDIAPMLFTTPTGWAMLAVGSVTGGLFAAFSFAISVFSIPMLLNERTDALTAMGTSTALVWNNLPVMLTWSAIARAVRAEPCDRSGRADHRVSGDRTRHLACLSCRVGRHIVLYF